jgi:F-type H+-transporting ATPase subunit delta
MGSATRNAVAAATAALAARTGSAALAGSALLAVGEELLSAGRVIGDSAQLLGALADPSAEPAAKRSLVDSVFASLGTESRELLSGLAQSRWSDQVDLLAGVEELGLRALASSAGADAGSSIDIPAELFAFGRLVASNSELELAVGSKLGDPAAKAALVEKLLHGHASEQAIAIVRHLVQQPRGRRIGALLRHAADIVADQSSLVVATVTVAAPLSAGQLDRLRVGLAKKYGDLRINQVVDPALIGGVRVAVGGEVIDDSVATRLKELRLQLAG